MHIVRVAAAAALLLFYGASLASADTITTFGQTTGSGPWNLTSTSSTYSGIADNLSTPITFNSITSLDVIFNDIAGGADAGSPRLELDTSGSDYFTVYLGTPPNFNDSNPATFTSAFSGVNLDNGTNNSTFQIANTYQTLASLQSTYGADLISEIDLITDSGYAANGSEDLTLSALDVNGTNRLSPSTVPEPASIAILSAGMLGFFGLARRRRKTSKSCAVPVTA